MSKGIFYSERARLLYEEMLAEAKDVRDRSMDKVAGLGVNPAEMAASHIGILNSWFQNLVLAKVEAAKIDTHERYMDSVMGQYANHGLDRESLN